MSELLESIPLHRESVDVAVLLGLTVDIMQRQASASGVRLTVRVDDDVPSMVRLDREKVAWAVTSLVGSALRHVQGPGAWVDVHASSQHGELSICVRDNGPGITTGQLHKLWQRDQWQPGMGLALLMVRDIATAHGGTLAVSSRTAALDHFTSVCFTIAHADSAALRH